MPQTLEQINALRRIKGEPLLTELPPAEPPVATKEEGNNEKTASTTDNNQPTSKDVPPSPITDDLVIKFLQEKGIAVNSLDDLNKPTTEVDEAKKAEDRENAKLTYGLNKGLFNRKTHEQFILDKSNKQQLVYAQYYQDAKKEDPDLSDEDIQAEFASKYGLDAEPNSRKHKRGVQEIEILGDIILKNRYQNIFKLDSEYEVYEKQTTSQKDFERKILLEAPNYKKTIDEVFAEVRKITTKFSDDESYDVELVDDSITSLKEKFLDKEFVAQKIKEGYSKDQLKEIAFTAILRENWSLIAKEIITQALLKQQKGVKGIMPVGKQQPGDNNEQYTEQQKAVFQRLNMLSQPQGAN